MNKRIIALMLVVSMIYSPGLLAREIRTPLNLRQSPTGAFHAPLTIDDEKTESRWWGDFDVWAGAYAQSADNAFGPCHGTKTVPLTQIFFDKTTFTGKEFFANNTITNGGAATTILTVANITPRVEYDEQGVVFGFNHQHRLKRNDRVRFGMRASLPYRVIEMRRTDACGECACEIGETIADLCKEQSDLFVAGSDPAVTVDTTINNDWACRLDFVSALCYASCTKKVVEYGNGTNAVKTKMATTDVTQEGNIAPEATVGLTGNPIHLRQVTVGATPTGLLAAPLHGTVDALPFLNAAGTGPGVGNRTRFDLNVNYGAALAGDGAAQSKFWVVPTLVRNNLSTTDPLVLSADSVAIKDLIDQLTAGIDTSLRPFFESQGISFGDEKNRGIGDLDTDLFAGYMFRDNLYAEVEFGVRWPTGKKICSPNRLYLIPRGNNGHYELKVGTMGWWAPTSWFIGKADLYFRGALKGHERVAASFVGATVKNIGPAVDANISWNRVVMHLDATFVHPENPGLGFDIGYEFYRKSCDKICFTNNCDTKCKTPCGDSCVVPAFVGTTNGTTMPDFFGVTQKLDPSVLARNTNVISHKIRVELFHHMNFGEIFAGWTQVVAGKNAMQETSWDLGMSIRY